MKELKKGAIVSIQAEHSKGGKSIDAQTENTVTIAINIKLSSFVLYPVTGVLLTKMNCQDTMPRKELCTKPKRSGS